jgi:hypothetical protein
MNLVASFRDASSEAFDWGHVKPLRVEGIDSVILQYSDGPTRLPASALWREGPRLIYRHVAECLRLLQKGRGPLVLGFHSAPKFKRRIGTRVRTLTSAEEVILDWGLSRDSYAVAGNIQRVDSSPISRYAEAAILLKSDRDLRSVERLLAKYFDWHSFFGYVLPTASRLGPRDLLNGTSVLLGDYLRTRLRVLRAGGLYFEDWDDGCGLKIWAESSQMPGLRASLPLDALIDLLPKSLVSARPSTPPKPSVVAKRL